MVPWTTASTSPPSPCPPPHLPCRNMKQGITLFVQKVFDLPIVGRFKLLHIMLWLTAVAFLGEPLPSVLGMPRRTCRRRTCPSVHAAAATLPLPALQPAHSQSPAARPTSALRLSAQPPRPAGTARQLQQLHAQQSDAVWATPNMEIHFLSKRWRAERNLWWAAAMRWLWGVREKPSVAHVAFAKLLDRRAMLAAADWMPCKPGCCVFRRMGALSLERLGLTSPWPPYSGSHSHFAPPESLPVPSPTQDGRLCLQLLGLPGRLLPRGGAPHGARGPPV